MMKNKITTAITNNIIVTARTTQPSVFDRYAPTRRTRRLSDVTRAWVVSPVVSADRSAGTVSDIITLAYCVLGAHATSLKSSLVHDAPLTMRALRQPTGVGSSNCNKTERTVELYIIIIIYYSRHVFV